MKCGFLKSDLNYIHESLKNNFSGYLHSEALRKTSDEVFDQELAKAKDCKSNIDYMRAIKRYFASFHDPHVKAVWNGLGQNTELIEISSGKKLAPDFKAGSFVATGIYLVRYGDRYFVRGIDETLLPDTQVKVSHELLLVDGKRPRDIIESDILPFESVSVQEAASYRYAPAVFFRWDVASGTLANCKFSDGKHTYEVPLKWQEVSDNYMRDSFQKPPTKFYELSKTNYGHWLKLSSFAGYGPEASGQLKSFVDDAFKLRKDKVIVIDVRGNTGGNSSWGSAWIENLFGFKNDPGHVRSYVLSSPGNRQHFERLYEHLKKNNGIPDPQSDADWQQLLKALSDHPSGFAEIKETNRSMKKSESPHFKGKLIVLTDFMVFSSGEIFVKDLKRMPGVEQAGMPTDASTYYSDIRFDIAPSGLPFNFPTMVEMDGFTDRGSGEPLKPEIQLTIDPVQEFKGQDSVRTALELMIAKRSM